MITTVADLLNAFKIKEEELLATYGSIKHPVLIGSMYEGLTKNILDKSVFKDLGLKVTAGKIRNINGKMSEEIDCMLVIGDGEPIPYTDKEICAPNQVVAVIQVKKNLYSKDIRDSYSNLRSVLDIADGNGGEYYHGRILRDSFRLICRRELPERSAIKNLPFEIEMIYHILLLDAFHPVRIVWGYNGFASEFSLREAFVKYLEANTTTSPTNRIEGYGPLNMPNLIMCGESCIIKINGMPFGSPLDNGWWDLLATTTNNPIYAFLEVIWTRLQYMFGISADIFGDDLEVDQMHPFLRCRLRQTLAMNGWEYYYNFISSKDLVEHPIEKKDWEPVFLNETQFFIMNELCAKGNVDYINNQEINEFIIQSGQTIDEFVATIVDTGLVYSDGTKLHLLTDECMCGISPKGQCFAGDNRTGRVSRWLAKMM